MSFKIAIASGKGGTGKTTVSVNLYNTLTTVFNHKVILVDCDVEEPNDIIFFNQHIKSTTETIHQMVPEIDITKCTFCKACSEHCEFNAISVIPSANFITHNESLCHACGACLFFCNQQAISESKTDIGRVNTYKLPNGLGLLEGELKIGSTMQTMLIKALKTKITTEPDITLLDAPPGTSCPVVETVSDADFVILVSEPTPFGLHDLKLIVELLDEIKIPYGLILNKAGLGNHDIYDFTQEKNIEILGELPFCKNYASKYANGDILNNDHPEFIKVYNSIAQNLISKIGIC